MQAEATAKDRRIEDLSRALTVAENRCSEHEERSRAHFEETAALSRLLLNSEQQSLKEIEKLRRIRELFSVLARRPRWWAILPRPHQSRLEHKKLRRLGLFDDQSYLWKNPDVAASGMDPLKHFIIHGIDEDRQF